MTLTIGEVAQTSFRPTKEAGEINDTLQKALGMPHRYGPARLAIARSLSVEAMPLTLSEGQAEPGRTIRGDPLFGSEADTGAWLALIVEHAGRPLERKELQDLVTAHWARGAALLQEAFKAADKDYLQFIARLVEDAGLRESDPVDGGDGVTPLALQPAVPVRLRLGDPGTTVDTGQPVDWVMNGPGRSPHIAAMGTLGTGKTRIGTALLTQMRQQSGCAVLLFDFKGDLAENETLASSLEATVVRVPRDPVPLDVLAPAEADAQALDIAAMRFRDSFERVMTSKPGAIQRQALKDAARRALGGGGGVRLADIQTAIAAIYDETERSPDSVSATLDDLCSFELFRPELTADTFFQRSWIIDLHEAPETAQRLVAFLLFDAMDTWLKHQKDSVLDAEGHRALRSVLVIDEARRVLGYGQPSLIEIVRMSRSKGGAVMLISQSPDDFAQEDDDFLANIGLLFSFRTNAKPGSLQRVFGEKVDLAGLPDGVCITRLPEVARRPIRVQAWK